MNNINRKKDVKLKVYPRMVKGSALVDEIAGGLIFFLLGYLYFLNGSPSTGYFCIKF